MGQVSESNFDQDLLDLVQSNLVPLMRDSPDSDVHSAARWAIEKLDLETGPLDQLRSTDSSWYIKHFGSKRGKSNQVTFVRVDPHEVYVGFGLDDHSRRVNNTEPKVTRLDHSFYISAREVSARLYLDFLASIPPDDPIRDRGFEKLESVPNVPVTTLTWVEMCLFCNWLSREDGLSPHYVLAPSKVKKEGPDSRVFEATAPDANGYRLPSSLEWEAACRGETKTKYWFGDKLWRLNDYAITAVHPDLIADFDVSASGQKLPNRFGIFDMIGNARECTHEPRIMFENLNWRAVFGGKAYDDATSFQSSRFALLKITESSIQMPTRFMGIRLVVEINKR